MLFTDGGLYQGEFEVNKAHGKGVYAYVNGSKYEGEWEDDLQNGEGIMVWQDG